MDVAPADTDGETTKDIPEISGSASPHGLTLPVFCLGDVLQGYNAKQPSTQKIPDSKHRTVQPRCNGSKRIFDSNLNYHAQQRTDNGRTEKNTFGYKSSVPKAFVLKGSSRTENSRIEEGRDQPVDSMSFHAKQRTTETERFKQCQPVVSGCDRNESKPAKLSSFDVLDCSVARKVFKAFNDNHKYSDSHRISNEIMKGAEGRGSDELLGECDASKKKRKCAIITKKRIVLTPELAAELHKKKGDPTRYSSENRSSGIKSQSVKNTFGYKSSVPKVFVLKGSPRSQNKTKNKSKHTKQRDHAKRRPTSHQKPYLSLIPADDIKHFTCEKSFGPFYFAQQRKPASRYKASTDLSSNGTEECSRNEYISAVKQSNAPNFNSEEEEDIDIFYTSKSRSMISTSKPETTTPDENADKPTNYKQINDESRLSPNKSFRKQTKRTNNISSLQGSPISKTQNTADSKHSPTLFRLNSASPSRITRNSPKDDHPPQDNFMDKNSLNEISPDSGSRGDHCSIRPGKGSPRCQHRDARRGQMSTGDTCDRRHQRSVIDLCNEAHLQLSDGGHCGDARGQCDFYGNDQGQRSTGSNKRRQRRQLRKTAQQADPVRFVKATMDLLIGVHLKDAHHVEA